MARQRTRIRLSPGARASNLEVRHSGDCIVAVLFGRRTGFLAITLLAGRHTLSDAEGRWESVKVLRFRRRIDTAKQAAERGQALVGQVGQPFRMRRGHGDSSKVLRRAGRSIRQNRPQCADPAFGMDRWVSPFGYGEATAISSRSCVTGGRIDTAKQAGVRGPAFGLDRLAKHLYGYGLGRG